MSARAGAFACIAVLAIAARAHWGEPGIVPVERLLPQLEARVAANAKDAHAHYLLGRVHSAAFANGCNGVVSWGLDSSFFVVPSDTSHQPPDCVVRTAAQRAILAKSTAKDLPPRLDARASLEHLERALDHLSLAVELAPGTALYELGLAFVLDTGAHLSAQVDSTPVWRSAAIQPSPELQREIATNIAVLGDPSAAVRLSAEGRLVEQLDAAVPLLNERRADSDALRQAAIARLLARAWREAAIRGYRRAHALTIDTDLEDGWIANAPGFFDALISVEAGRGYSRLVRDRGPKDDDELKHVESVEAALAELAKPEHQDYMVTPLLVPDASDATLDTLFDGASACFDLGGIGEQQRWPWPRESASFLVWDPECTGSITSGRQLFGSATWWMFFEDGYAALDALDADRDGWLTGAELEGLALWCDVDRDGVSDPGEVESLAARRIAALAARADGFDGISPMRSRGAALADGGELPTFDWIAAPVPDP